MERRLRHPDFTYLPARPHCPLTNPHTNPRPPTDPRAYLHLPPRFPFIIQPQATEWARATLPTPSCQPTDAYLPTQPVGERRDLEACLKDAQGFSGLMDTS